MPKLTYVVKNFQEKARQTIATANEIIHEYAEQGFDLTLRQLYYQFVARDIIPNTERSYKNLGKTINDGRLAGLIDWESITDRTRSLVAWQHETDPTTAIEELRDAYTIDMWTNQPRRVEVWIEKEALVGVIEDICFTNDVAYFACRGYVSQSEQWRAGRRFKRRSRSNQSTVVLHLGDHDPSGMDMTRDNADRLKMFSEFGHAIEVKRIALNMDQIEQYDPPPNPTKFTDSRAKQYFMDYGDSSWELDALEPRVLTALINTEISKIRDSDLWAEREAQLDQDRAAFDDIIDNLGSM